MAFELSVSREFEEEFSKLDTNVQKRVIEKLRDIAEDPAVSGKPLKRNLKGLWSARVRKYRIIYTIEADRGFCCYREASKEGILNFPPLFEG